MVASLPASSLVRGPASLAGQRPGVRHRTNMPELVGVHDRADDLDLPVQNVEDERVEHPAVPVAEDRSGLAVHLVRLDYDPDADELGNGRREHPRDVRRTDDRAGKLRNL